MQGAGRSRTALLSSDKPTASPTAGLISAPQSVQASIPPAAAQEGPGSCSAPAPHFTICTPGARCGGGAARFSRPRGRCLTGSLQPLDRAGGAQGHGPRPPP